MNFPRMEEEILKFWKDKKIFEKSVNKKAPRGDYVFYDGPPFATGTPHYGHIVASLMKDAVPRYFTMRGYRVERRWGWDCHGLPIENIVEQELGVTNKKDIEEKIGVDKFNELCRGKVLMFADVWKKFIPRMGRWVDMDNAYKTMDPNYMESIWWVFKQLWDKGLIYEGHKSMHICPRCETTLSQSEVSQGYKDIPDLAVTVKFELEDEPKTYILAWTTTPWTLPGNVALAVGENIDYLKVKSDNEHHILAKETAKKILAEKEYKIVGQLKGKDLAGKSYKPLFPYFDNPQNRKRGFKVYAADFVATEEGTGVVHIAPAFGEDDMKLGRTENLPFVQHVDFSGRFTPEIKDFPGELVKPTEDPQATDRKIVAWLEKSGKLFSRETHLHSYPFCWRCDAPLLYLARKSWYIKTTQFRDKLLEYNRRINWYPPEIGAGRFGDWLENNVDWALSRERFWGTPLPIWICPACEHQTAVGSVAQLRQMGVNVPADLDLHKPFIDDIELVCPVCSERMRRVPEVIDVWFDSGAMPFAQWHYPFEN